MVEALQRVEDVETGAVPLPYPVELPVDRLPRQAVGPRELARKIGILMALRLEDGLDAPVAISTRFAARLMHLPDPEEKGRKRASVWLKSLEEWGVIRYVMTLPPRGRQRGARCYQPGDRWLEDIAFDGLSEEQQEIHRVFARLDLSDEIAR